MMAMDGGKDWSGNSWKIGKTGWKWLRMANDSWEFLRITHDGWEWFLMVDMNLCHQFSVYSHEPFAMAWSNCRGCPIAKETSWSYLQYLNLDQTYSCWVVHHDYDALPPGLVDHWVEHLLGAPSPGYWVEPDSSDHGLGSKSGTTGLTDTYQRVFVTIG